jgi:hypothetical protein
MVKISDLLDDLRTAMEKIDALPPSVLLLSSRMFGNDTAMTWRGKHDQIIIAGPLFWKRIENREVIFTRDSPLPSCDWNEIFEIDSDPEDSPLAAERKRKLRLRMTEALKEALERK